MKFWKTVKPLFFDDQVVADTFNNCFNDIAKNLVTVSNKNLLVTDGEGGRKRPPFLQSVTNIPQRCNLAIIPYLRKNQIIYESRDTPLEVF